MKIHATLADLQHKMRAPKGKKNDFGGYMYRNAEMILAAFKGLNVPNASLTCSDTLAEVGGQIFVTSTARLTIESEHVEAQGHAMHPLTKKGMDASQITGSASSYARKYALCGLFAIEDESQDPDSRDNREERGQTKPPAPTEAEIARNIIEAVNEARGDKAELTRLWGNYKSVMAGMSDDNFDAVKKAFEAAAPKPEPEPKTNADLDDKIPF